MQFTFEEIIDLMQEFKEVQDKFIMHKKAICEMASLRGNQTYPPSIVDMITTGYVDYRYRYCVAKKTLQDILRSYSVHFPDIFSDDSILTH